MCYGVHRSRRSRSSSLLQHGTECKDFDRHEIKAPPGWNFKNNWEVDKNRAGDGEGK